MTMMQPIRYLFLALTLLPATPALSSGPGFDCAKATRQIDKAICAWDTVGSLDGRMADTFKATLAAQKSDAAMAAVRDGQKAWLTERDRRCELANVTPKDGSEDVDPRWLVTLADERRPGPVREQVRALASQGRSLHVVA
mgnify:CR=1 FL=1